MCFTTMKKAKLVFVSVSYIAKLDNHGNTNIIVLLRVEHECIYRSFSTNVPNISFYFLAFIKYNPVIFTAANITHVFVLVPPFFQSHFPLLSRLDKSSPSSLREGFFKQLVMEQIQYIFITFPLGDIYNPNTHITVIFSKYY